MSTPQNQAAISRADQAIKLMKKALDATQKAREEGRDKDARKLLQDANNHRAEVSHTNAKLPEKMLIEYNKQLHRLTAADAWDL